MAPVCDRPRRGLFQGAADFGEFTLEKIPTGTLLRVVEFGFDKLPSKRRLEAFPRNEGGWSQQIRNIAAHVEQAP